MVAAELVDFGVLGDVGSGAGNRNGAAPLERPAPGDRHIEVKAGRRGSLTRSVASQSRRTD